MSEGIVQDYLNLGANSGVERFEIGDDFIRVQFRDGFTYRYDHATTGAEHVERMKELAVAGAGLGSYITAHVRYAYSEKTL